MAYTHVSDVITPEVFTQYVRERLTDKNKLIGSGVMTTNSLINQKVTQAAGGLTVQMPFWGELPGSWSVISDSADVTPSKLTADKQIAVRHAREIAWESHLLAAWVAGDNPLVGSAFADEVAVSKSADIQAIARASLLGVIADNIANDSSDQVEDKSTQDGDNQTASNRISGSAIIDAAIKLGDHADNLTYLAVHSSVFADMQKQDLIDTKKASENNIFFDNYLGKFKIIVDDNLAYRVAGTTSGWRYYNWLFTPQALAYGESTGALADKDLLEVYRDAKGGKDGIIVRNFFAVHPFGYKFTSSSVAGTTPEISELQDATNWDRVLSDVKNARFVCLIVNSSVDV